MHFVACATIGASKSSTASAQRGHRSICQEEAHTDATQGAMLPSRRRSRAACADRARLPPCPVRCRWSHSVR